MSSLLIPQHLTQPATLRSLYWSANSPMYKQGLEDNFNSFDMNYRHKPYVDRQKIPRTATEMQEYLKHINRINDEYDPSDDRHLEQ